MGNTLYSKSYRVVEKDVFCNVQIYIRFVGSACDISANVPNDVIKQKFSDIIEREYVLKSEQFLRSEA